MRKKKKKRHSIKLGMPPGSIVHVGERSSEKVLLELIEYDKDNFQKSEISDITELSKREKKTSQSWINLCGLHDTEIVQKTAQLFGIHYLVLEDILNTEHRPKIEIFEDYIFIALKMLTYNPDAREIRSEHISIICGSDFVITFQERAGDILQPVRQRLETGKGRVRISGTDYLMYAIMDIIIDYYFLICEKINDEIDQLDIKVANDSDQKDLHRIHFLKKELIEFRRSVRPLRDIINSLLREESRLISDYTIPFFKDVQDHVISVSETIDSLRDMVMGLMDLYLSSISNRMNEVMKVLTIIATIFIPLSFLAGIYGMNFEFMPELKWHWGYYVFWIIIVLVSGGMLYYFKRKKWI